LFLGAKDSISLSIQSMFQSSSTPINKVPHSEFRNAEIVLAITNSSLGLIIPCLKS
jgi:hypothetical protein